MIAPLRLWLRRSSGLLAFPAMVVVVGLVLVSRMGWEWEWDWALSWGSASTIILGPVSAGLVAFDMSRRMSGSLASVSASAPRGGRGIAGLALAIWVYAVAAWGLGILFVVVRVVQHGATGVPALWIFAEAPIALLASVSFGAMVGTLITNVAAGPVAAVVVYLVPILGRPFGLSGLMTAGGATGSLVGSEPNPPVAIVTLAANLVLVLLCGLIVLGRRLPVDRLRSVSAAVSGAGLVGLVLVLAVMNPLLNSFRPSVSSTVCEGATVEVCGPAESGAVIALAQRGLSDARENLAKAGLDTGTRYALVTGNVEVLPENGVGMLTITPEGLSTAGLADWDIASALATPTVCEEFFGEAPPTKLLDGQYNLIAWIMDQLGAIGHNSPEDLESARETYEAMAGCDPAAIPAWDYGADWIAPL